MMINSYYHTPTDIAFYFRSKESISELFNFILDEVEEFSEIIDQHDNQIPYPIIYSDLAYVYQIDYQFYIHCLAKFVAIKTKAFQNYVSVLNAFAITRTNIFDNSLSIPSRNFLTLVHEELNPIFEINRITKTTSFTIESLYSGKLKGRKPKSKGGANLFDAMVNFIPVLYEFKGLYFEYKTINLRDSDKNYEEAFHGIANYSGDKWKKIRDRYKRNMTQNKMKQVAYGAKAIKKFVTENQTKRVIFFHINTAIFKEKPEYINYYLASQLSNNFVNFDEDFEGEFEEENGQISS